jgi:hypothetical protein
MRSLFAKLHDWLYEKGWASKTTRGVIRIDHGKVTAERFSL